MTWGFCGPHAARAAACMSLSGMLFGNRLPACPSVCLAKGTVRWARRKISNKRTTASLYVCSTHPPPGVHRGVAQRLASSYAEHCGRHHTLQRRKKGDWRKGEKASLHPAMWVPSCHWLRGFRQAGRLLTANDGAAIQVTFIGGTVANFTYFLPIF